MQSSALKMPSAKPRKSASRAASRLADAPLRWYRTFRASVEIRSCQNARLTAPRCDSSTPRRGSDCIVDIESLKYTRGFWIRQAACGPGHPRMGSGTSRVCAAPVLDCSLQAALPPRGVRMAAQAMARVSRREAFGNSGSVHAFRTAAEVTLPGSFRSLRGLTSKGDSVQLRPPPQRLE